MNFRSVRNLLFALVVLCMSAASFAQLGVMITIAPPALPVYEQPICPGDGYIWTPGYWAWGDDFNDYYWVPGTWVMAPEVGFLWTPAYWGWGGDRFVFYDGYWGPTIGFYGGINYGFGYFGTGFEGGRWDNGHFFYNRSVTNVNVTVIHNVYNTTVINSTTVNRVSYNGGNGGISARPTPEQEAAAHERHIAPVASQTQHLQEARSNPQQRASMNEGKPAVAATSKPGDFKGNVVQAKEAGAPYARSDNRDGNHPGENAPAAHPENNAARPNAPAHVRDLPPTAKPAAPNTGDPKLDKKYQQQQEKQFAQQEQERQKTAQKQAAEDQKLAKQNASDAKKQQVEQQHQQQTQQLQQRHDQQQQQLQQRQQPPATRGEQKPH
jgi:hypothetical protein